jgi:CHAT domain-containing protein
VTERHRPIALFELFWEVLLRAPGLGLSMIGEVLKSRWWIVFAVVGFVYVDIDVGLTKGARVYEGWGLSHGQAKLFAGSLSVLGLLLLATVFAKVLTAAYSRLRPSFGLLLVAAIPPTIYVCASLNVGFHVPLALALAIALVSGALGVRYVRYALSRIPNPVRVQLWLDDPTRAEDLVRECEEALADPGLTSDERVAVEANLASGLIAMALLSVSDDGLPRAYEILMLSLDKMDPMDAYIGAARLVDAMGTKASRTGDIDGYEEALRLMLDAASIMGRQLRCVMARARLIHATHLAVLASRATSDGEPGRAARLHQQALDELLGVVQGSSRRSIVHALAQVKFASLVDRTGGDLDAAIALSRGALRRLWLRPRLERDFARLVLCGLLTDRAQLDGPSARRDLAEATRLCLRLHRGAASRADAVRRLPTLMRLSGADAREVAGAYRRAFEELSPMSGGGAGDLAAEWSAWAIAASDAAEAAEAHWCWIRAVAEDARRRPLQAEKERRLSRFLGLASQTGACLIAAGRLQDAAVAFDIGRAMLLTERMQREREGIVARLVDAGREDLADRWREAQQRIAEADRAAFSTERVPSRTMLVGGRSFQPRFTSSEHLALADLEQLLREIGRVPGCEDVDAPPDYDDLRAAACEGPIVYLSAAADRTHAVIVTDAGAPRVVSLKPTDDEVSALARSLVEASDPGKVLDLTSAVIRTLWADLVEPIAAHLPSGSLVTLIPLGALSLLPLHAAGALPDDDGVWRDRSGGLVFRYAPNARVLGRAQAHARSIAGQRLRVLTVDVPDAPGEAQLLYAADESDGVVAEFGTSRTLRPRPVTRGAVLRAMDSCGIWHFACHGVHRRSDPLESSLVLADGRLTLRAIFARPAGPRRLAVLSVCRTAAPDQGLLDEVVSFPSALLQSGVAGVVCAQSDVVDRAAMLVILRFFAELESGATPPMALARAQAWLRTATNEQIHAQLPAAYALPPGSSPAQLAEWNELREFADPICWAPLSYSGA